MALQIDKALISEKIGITFEIDEEIKWVGKPILKVYLLNELKNQIISLFVIVGIVLLFQIIAYLFKSTYQWKETIFFFGIITSISIGKVVWLVFKLQKTTYVITNLNIIVYNDFYGTTIKTIYTSEIQTKEVKKSFIDKYFGTGSILIFTGETKENDGKLEKQYDVLTSVIEADKVYLMI